MVGGLPVVAVVKSGYGVVTCSYGVVMGGFGVVIQNNK